MQTDRTPPIGEKRTAQFANGRFNRINFIDAGTFRSVNDGYCKSAPHRRLSDGGRYCEAVSHFRTVFQLR